MTCIVGMVWKNNRVFIGGDSAASSGDIIYPVMNPKVFFVGDFLIGYTTSFRMGQLLQYTLKVPKHEADESTGEFMVCKFAESVRLCLKQGGFSHIENNEENGGTFLIGYKGGLFCMQDNFQVLESVHGMHGIGSGREYAMGALYSQGAIRNPKNAISEALHAAEAFSPFVRGPYTILSTPGSKR